MGVEAGLSYPKSTGWSGPEISACHKVFELTMAAVLREPLPNQLSGLPGLPDSIRTF